MHDCAILDSEHCARDRISADATQSSFLKYRYANITRTTSLNIASISKKEMGRHERNKEGLWPTPLGPPSHFHQTSGQPDKWHFRCAREKAKRETHIKIRNRFSITYSRRRRSSDPECQTVNFARRKGTRGNYPRHMLNTSRSKSNHRLQQEI